MKILVVDDERPIREWLSMTLIRITSYVDQVVTASNGKEAIQKYLTELPDLIITDIKMPAMSGLELMEEVKKRDVDAAFVVLTCHEEFAYARKALQMGALEYLLKTDIQEEQLIAVLKKIESTEKNGKKGEDIFFQRQRFVVDVLERNFMPNHEALEKLGAFKNESDYFVMALKLAKDHILSDMKDKLVLEGYSSVFFLYGKDILFVLVWTDRNNSLLIRLNKIQRFASMTHNQLNTAQGFSKMYTMPEQLGLALHQALRQLNQGFYRRERVAFEDFSVVRKVEFDFEKETAEVLNNLYLNDRYRIIENIREWLRRIEENAVTDSGQLKISCLKVLEKLQEKYKVLQIEKKDIAEAESFTKIKKYFDDILSDLQNLDLSRGSAYITQALDYIENHYWENCSLEQISAAVGLNPEYFSRLFKQHMKQTYNFFLTNYRIEAAKKLLIESQESISDIAEKVGYHNMAYFSRVFKKNTGLTPFEFRN